MSTKLKAVTPTKNPVENPLIKVFEQIQVSIAYLDAQGNYLMVNRLFAESLGKQPADFIGLNAFTPESDPQGRDMFMRVLETGQPFTGFSVPYQDPQHPDRPVTYWDWNLQPITETDGSISGVLFTTQNVTGRENVNKALEETQALFQLLFESAPDANVLVNEQGVILAINTQAETMFGYRRAELIGNKIEVLLPERFSRIHPRVRSSYIASPHMRTMGAGLELFAQRSNREEFPVDVVLSPFKTDSGMLILSVIRDITTRKKMQSELDEVQHKLLHQTEHERVRLARELHDGPIQELYGLTFQLTEQMDRLGEQGQALSHMRERLQNTITELREIMSSLRPPTLAPFGLERTIRSHAETFRKVNKTPELHLSLEHDGQRLTSTTRLALYRIYQETLNNALRHAQAKNIYVHFALDAHNVELTVRDDGIGFVLPDHWVQLARKGHFGLVGIRERVEALGGQLEIKSKPGSGTSFHIVVPLEQELED